MKVLAVSASPRDGGNSDVLCDQFLKGAAEIMLTKNEMAEIDKQLDRMEMSRGFGGSSTEKSKTDD